MSHQQQPKVLIKIDEEYSYYQCMLVGSGELGEAMAQQIHALDDIGILGKASQEILNDPHEIMMLFIIGTAADLASQKASIEPWLGKAKVSLCFAVGATANDPELNDLTGWLDTVIPTDGSSQKDILDDLYWKMRLLARVENPGGIIHLTTSDVVFFFKRAGIVLSERFFQASDETFSDIAKRIINAEWFNDDIRGLFGVTAIDENSNISDRDGLTSIIYEALRPENGSLAFGFGEEMHEDSSANPAQIILFKK